MILSCLWWWMMHFSRRVCAFLDRKCPDRWIGRGGPISWPLVFKIWLFWISSSWVCKGRYLSWKSVKCEWVAGQNRHSCSDVLPSTRGETNYRLGCVSCHWQCLYWDLLTPLENYVESNVCKYISLTKTLYVWRRFILAPSKAGHSVYKDVDLILLAQVKNHSRALATIVMYF